MHDGARHEHPGRCKEDSPQQDEETRRGEVDLLDHSRQHARCDEWQGGSGRGQQGRAERDAEGGGRPARLGAPHELSLIHI